MQEVDMSKSGKSQKQHFELSPANSRRLDEYLERYNEDPYRVTPRIKIGDVVNRAMEEWLARRPAVADEGGSDDA
jgi:hypothetical protein